MKNSSYKHSISSALRTTIKSEHLGSANQILPIIAAFIFFILFIAGSLWFVARSRIPATSQQVTSPGSFPNVPGGKNPSWAQHATGALTPGFPSPASKSSTPASLQLDGASARQLVEAWHSYKKTIFSSPYDLSNLNDYIVNPGPLHSEITRVGGSVDWLRSNNASYIYKQLDILSDSDFRQFPDRAHLTVKVIEDLELRTPQGIDKSKSGSKTQSWIYELKLHNGKWLIYDYRKDI
jgi:hypothetical protein